MAIFSSYASLPEAILLLSYKKIGGFWYWATGILGPELWLTKFLAESQVLCEARKEGILFCDKLRCAMVGGNCGISPANIVEEYCKAL